MLTKEEQEKFEKMFERAMETKTPKAFLNKLGDALFEMTGNVNLRTRLSNIGNLTGGKK